MSVDVKSLFKDPKSYLIGVILVFSADKIWGYIQKGAEVDFNTAIQEQVVIGLKNPNTIKELVENEAFVDLFFNSKMVRGKINELSDKLNNEIRNEIIEDVSKQDTNKISTRAEISKRLDIREENYFPLLEKALRAVKDEKNVSKNGVKEIIRREVKPEARKVPVF
jgi:hypothetical protein